MKQNLEKILQNQGQNPSPKTFLNIMSQTILGTNFLDLEVKYRFIVDSIGTFYNNLRKYVYQYNDNPTYSEHLKPEQIPQLVQSKYE